MTRYLKKVLGPTPQSEPLIGREKDMVKNSAGGYTFEVDDFVRLQRFLILGSEGGSYYAEERELTVENARCVHDCIGKDPERTLNVILECTRSSPKNDQCLFALAMMAANTNNEARRLALGDQKTFNSIVRISTHLFQFISYVTDLRGWGRSLRTAIAGWYLGRNPESLSYQVTKYRNRHGWTHRDVMRKVHPKADAVSWEEIHKEYGMDADLYGDQNSNAMKKNAIFNWVTKDVLPDDVNVPIVSAHEESKTASVPRVIELIHEVGMTWEMLPTTVLKNPDVWAALLNKMPVNAMMRNLGRMTSIGTLGVFNENNRHITHRMLVDEVLQNDRLHPLTILMALMQYKEGKGMRGSLEWEPVPEIVDSLDNAFSKSFQFAPATGKRFYVGLDVSGSMVYSGGMMGMPQLTPMVAATCIAMTIARREPNSYISAFCDHMQRVDFTGRSTLAEAVRFVNDELSFGRTNCALPMLDAAEKKIPVDCFVVLTDNETWYGDIHPVQALEKYRREMSIPAKLVVIGMTATKFSIADPNDVGMMDMVGFDSGIPRLLNLFASDGIASA